MLKLIILLTTITLSATSFASQETNQTSNWLTNGLNEAETQAIDEASQAELTEVSGCMAEANETEISETSCINEVFGDVHN